MMNALRDIVQHNLLVKICALVIAILLWLYVMNDQNPAIEGSYSIPVSMADAPDGYRMHASAETVTIRVRAPRSAFVAADRGDFHAKLNFADYAEGDKNYPVETTIPYGFELISTSPDKITVSLDRIVQKSFKVDVMTSGTPASGVAVDKISQTVAAATVEGPRSEVDRVTRIVAHVNLGGQGQDFSVAAPLLAMNSDGRESSEVVVSPSQTEIAVKLARGLTRKVVEIKVKAQSDLSPNLKLEGITAAPARIEIAGAEDVLKSITSIDTEELSLADVKENETRRVQLRLPAGVTVTDPNVTVEIKVGAMK
ncbi:YbbR-like domain-containing protein [Selenomonas artemidis]|uniref:YbbR-like protein n=1 Tax=Selenomonas artemidis F0399 TaxID=749551 RepID=E7N0T6_9FIRM|nr:YbbR-like protein [Selenomonas artemidis F0399]